MPRIPLDDRRRQTASQIAALTVANALIFQELLAHEDSRVQPLNRLLDRADFLSATVTHWKFICDEINYVPIFHLAREVLLHIPVNPDADVALRALAGNSDQATSPIARGTARNSLNTLPGGRLMT